MSAKNRKLQGGQALVMVTLALIAMCGLMGLAVDLGWSFFVRKQAQAAADAAAQAAVKEALTRLGSGGTAGFTCPVSPSATTPWCQPTVVDCPSVNASSNLHNGCQYATANGFTHGGKSGRQAVTIIANTGPAPTAAGVNDVVYWVTVRINETIPQLFSAVLGNTEGTISARATAGIVSVVTPGSLILINREADAVGMGSGGSDMTGINLSGSGTITVNASSGVTLASQCFGQNTPNGCTNSSAESNGNSNVLNASKSEFRGTGDNTNWSGTWNAPEIHGQGEGFQFQDPTQGRAQPPLLNTNNKTCGLINGALTGPDPLDGNPLVAGPFHYYSYSQQGSTNVPNTNPITIRGDVRFSPTGTCPGVLSSDGEVPTGFTSYYFWGGLDLTSSGGGNLKLTFEPGQYVFVGSRHASGQNPATPLWNISVGGTADIRASGSGDDYPGSMFLFTSPTYDQQVAGEDTLLTYATGQPTTLGAVQGQLYQGQAGFQTGGSGNQIIDLWGLNKNSSAGIPAALKDYGGVLFWQDRDNSRVRYTADGHINANNGTGADVPDDTCASSLCVKNSGELTTDRVTGDSTTLWLKAAPGISLNGVIYQPRGSFTDLQGGGNYTGPLQLISGAVRLGGSGTLTLLPVALPLANYVVSLIE